MTTTHQATAWPSLYVVVRSPDAPTPESAATGEGSLFYTLAHPIEAPHGTRLLVSVQQLTYSTSFQNVRTANSTYTVSSPSRDEVREGVVTEGVWTNESLAVALNDLEEETMNRAPLRVSFDFSSVTGKVTASRSVPFALGGPLMRTLGFASWQLDDVYAHTHTGYYASSLRIPHRALLLQSTMATHVECSNGNRGAGVLARIPIEHTIAEPFECAHWAPLHPIPHLLHDRHVDALSLRLIDADTHDPVTFTDETGWAVGLSFHIVVDPPRQIPPEHAVVGRGVPSQTTHDHDFLQAQTAPRHGVTNQTSRQARGQDGENRIESPPVGASHRKPARPHRRGRRRRKRPS